MTIVVVRYWRSVLLESSQVMMVGRSNCEARPKGNEAIKHRWVCSASMRRIQKQNNDTRHTEGWELREWICGWWRWEVVMMVTHIIEVSAWRDTWTHYLDITRYSNGYRHGRYSIGVVTSGIKLIATWFLMTLTLPHHICCGRYYH